MLNLIYRIALVVPTLNELNGLKTIMPQVKKEWVDQIIILDGKSTDGSIEWCKQQGYEVFIQDKPGMWHAYRELFNSGMVKGDIVVTFSPDGNSVPSSIPVLARKVISGYDIVIGSRYLGGHKSPDDTKLTAIGNKIFNGMCNWSTGYHYTDSLVMLRAYKTSIVKELGFLEEPNWLQKQLIKASPLYGWESSMSIRANKAHMLVSEEYFIEPKAFRKRRQNTFVHGGVIGIQILSELFGGVSK
jgi:glycosyltransferase involved in cell wall biosynthesis